ncbi:MAG: GNAT family N-acetyltransferase [Acidimicrobiales bacterium]|jgi:GNAT superfamily N-acetyltransferase
MQSEHSELRDAFDEQVRRNVTPDGSGATGEYGVNFVRRVANDGPGWCEVSWSSLDAMTADEAIAAQIEFYRSRNLSFVWRVYDYDRPTDLGERLVNAGFIDSGTSAVMIAESSRLSREPVLPEGTELLRVSDEAGVELLIEVHESVFGHSHEELRRSILRRLDVAPQETDMFVVMAGDVPVSSSRIEFFPASDFAGLWGGSTVPEWRGKGIYRALVFRRARLAQERGYRYLMVMASDNSRPILNQLGFQIISRATTYSWKPSALE